MSSEASKIRNQCYQKYALKLKGYQEQIAALTAELDKKDAQIEELEKIQRDYVKLLYFLNLSEEDRNRVLRSGEVQEATERLRKFHGALGSALLGGMTSAIMSGEHVDFEKSLKEMLEKGMM